MWDWFAHYWSTMGLGGGVVLGLLLFFTNVCRHNLDVSRWRDPVWIAWLNVLAYLLHNFEEYGLDIFGRSYQFPASVCEQFGYASVEACPVSPAYVVAVNIPWMWVALPIAALWGRSNPAVALAGSGFLFVNGLGHSLQAIGPMGYSPGTLTSVLIFLPLTLWSFATFFGPDKLLRYPVLGAILLAGVLSSAVLGGLIVLFFKGLIDNAPLFVLQQLAPTTMLVVPWLASRKWPPFAEGGR